MILLTSLLDSTLCSQFMRFRIMRFSIYAVLENGPNSCFMLQYSHIMRFLVKIIVYKILLIFFLHLCYSCIMRFLLGNKKRINGELSVFEFTSISGTGTFESAPNFLYNSFLSQWFRHFSILSHTGFQGGRYDFEIGGPKKDFRGKAFFPWISAKNFSSRGFFPLNFR